MPFLTCIKIAVVAYLMGSIPFGYLLIRFVRKEDIREKGSGNIGATNVLRSGSKGLGALTFLLDAAKGYAAVVAGELILTLPGSEYMPIRTAAAIAGVFAILGHVFPVWLGFKGGKGVATAWGLFLALMPLTALVTMGVFILVFALSRYVSLASLAATIALPLLGLFLDHGEHSLFFMGAIIFIAALIIVKHHENIRRLIAGTEYRFGKSKASAA